MAFNINDLTQYFDNPSLSKFNRTKRPSFDLNIGPMIPANWEILNFGNSIKGTSFHTLRLSPMLAPNFSDLQVQEHTAAVPLRVIMKNYEETFNYSINRDGAILPHFTAIQYHNILKTMCLNGLNPIGSLLDFMGFPVYGDLYDCIPSISSTLNGDSFDLYSINSLNFYYAHFTPATRLGINFKYRDQDYQSNTSLFDDAAPLDLISFVATRKFPTISNGGVLDSSLASIHLLYQLIFTKGKPTEPFWNEEMASFVPTITDIVEVSSFDTVVSMLDAYNSYLFGFLLNIYLSNNIIPEDAPNYSTLPLRAYWRFHIDWNTNGNFVDRDVLLDDLVFNLEDSLIRSINTVSSLVKSTYKRLLFPANRLWTNDFWTSQLPTSAVDNAIEIPANSTILNLASLTAFQKLVLKLSYSSRYRDVVWNVFKITPSDARLQQSSVISRRYHSVGIGETLQTSETTVSSVLGSFAGRGYSSGKSDYYHIMAEEPLIIINFFSLVPLPSYSDALHPNIHLDDIFDLPIPDMDVLGNQPIYADLLSGNVTDSKSVFGFGRQYQEFLSNYDTVHGKLKTSLSYWQLSRRFGSTPVLNDTFLRISDRDDFDNIFSVPESSHASATVLYKYHVTRHVHRNVRILI